ncbi:MAG: helix-turn-helix domain-containing protein [Nitrospirota bacterium]
MVEPQGIPRLKHRSSLAGASSIVRRERPSCFLYSGDEIPSLYIDVFLVDIKRALGNNPALFTVFPLGTFMSLTPSVFSILLLSGDPDIQSQFKHTLKDASVTVAKYAATLPKDVTSRTFDAVIVELKSGSSPGISAIPAHIDLTHTVVIVGSRTALKRASKFMQVTARQKAVEANGNEAISLEDYLEWKMGEFVKGMRNGSGRNLHSMLISAIERPLITRALQETNGNQIQAAELLGLNRNTLRKKIQDLHIPMKRNRTAKTREA